MNPDDFGGAEVAIDHLWVDNCCGQQRAFVWIDGIPNLLVEEDA